MVVHRQVSWVKPLALAVLLFALGSFAWWSEYTKKPKKEAQEEASKKPFLLKGTTVHSMSLKSGEGHSFDFSCLDLSKNLCKPGENSKWEVTSPKKLLADNTAVNSLLSTLDNLNASDVFDLSTETPEKRTQLLQQYGLSEKDRAAAQARSVAVESANGRIVAYFGATHPISQGIFVAIEKVPPGHKPTGKIDENHVYVVPGYFQANFDHDVGYWRDKRVVTVAASEVTAFDLKDSHGLISGTRKDGVWTLKTPEGEVAGDIENVDSLLNGVNFMIAQQVVSDEKNSSEGRKILQGLPTLATLTLKREKGAPVTLTVYEKKGKESKVPHGPKKGDHDVRVDGGALYATTSDLDPVFELQNGNRNLIDKSSKDLRLNKLITSVDRFKTKAIEIAGKPVGEPAIVLTEKDGRWTSSAGGETSSEKIQKLLDQLSGNRIQEYLKPGSVPAGEDGALRISLRWGDDGKLETRRQIAFWKKDGKLFARDLSSSRHGAYQVDSTIISSLPWDRNYFNKPTGGAKK